MKWNKAKKSETGSRSTPQTIRTCLSLPLTRVWFRYRARAIPKVKGNHKQSYEDMSCTLCTSKEEMSQEHLESCEGTEHERRGLNMGTWRGLLDFWRRMMKKLGATVT